MFGSAVVDWLRDNAWNITSITISVILAIVGIYLTIRSKREKKPSFMMRTSSMIQGAKSRFPDLTVHYKGHGEDLEHFSVSLICFWNDGGETIHGADITESEPLRINANGTCKILGVSILQVNKPANQVKCVVARTKDSVAITFDYLDKGNGAVIELMHTGQSSKDLDILGEIKGAAPPARVYPLPISFLHSLGSRTRRTRSRLRQGERITFTSWYCRTLRKMG
jgi:hypothetical protein